MLDHVRFRGSAQRLETTDSHKIATVAVEFIPVDIEALVPWRGLKKIMEIIPSKGDVNLTYDTKYLGISFGCISISLRLTEGKYVDTDKLWGAGFPEIPIWCSKKKLDKGLRCTALLGKATMFNFIQDGIQLYSEHVDLGNCKVKSASIYP